MMDYFVVSSSLLPIIDKCVVDMGAPQGPHTSGVALTLSANCKHSCWAIVQSSQIHVDVNTGGSQYASITSNTHVKHDGMVVCMEMNLYYF